MSEDGMLSYALLIVFIVLIIYVITFLFGISKLVRWLYKRCRKKGGLY